MRLLSFGKSRSVVFFQAEDGIRDDLVTGVETCGLPISTGVGGKVSPPESSEQFDAVILGFVVVELRERVRLAELPNVKQVPGGFVIDGGADLQFRTEIGRASGTERGGDLGGRRII